MKKIIKILFLTMVFSGLAGLFGKYNNFGFGAAEIVCTGIVSATTAALYEFIDTHNQGLFTWFKSQICYNNTDIYLSFSYIYRIIVDGKYLLIRGNRIKNQYQPIGGVYKYYDEAKPFLGKICANPETSVVGNDEADDLRLRIKAKHLLKFYDWFLCMCDREYDPIREFNEEMIKSNLLPEDYFRYLKYRKVGVHNKGITKSALPNKMQEVIYSDIFELILSPEQEELIRKAVIDNSDILCLVTADEIRNMQRSGNVEMDLSNNAVWLLCEE